MIALCIKDIKLLLSERRSLIILFIMPIVLTTILSFALKGSFESGIGTDLLKIGIVSEYDVISDEMLFGQHFELALTEEDLPDFESLFYNEFLDNEDVKSLMTYQKMTMTAAKDSLASNTIDAYVILPEKFIFNQMVNFYTPYRNEVTIEVIAGPDSGYKQALISKVIQIYFDELNLSIVQKNTLYNVLGSNTSMKEKLEAIEPLLESSHTEATIQDVLIPGYREMDSFTYYAIAMMAMFILYSASYSAKSLMREKQGETLSRARVSGIHNVQMIASKGLMTVMLVCIQMSFLLLYAVLVLGVTWEISLPMLISIILSAIAVSGLGALIGAIALMHDNPHVVGIFENIIIHVFALIGGSYIPVDVLPTFLQHLKFIAFNGIALDLFINVFQMQKISIFIPKWGMMLAFALLTYAVATRLVYLKERVERV